MKKPSVYYAQNTAIHKARAQLGLSIDDVRAIAGTLNLGVQSISRLTLTQREALIARLIALGATVRNPSLTPYDLEEEDRIRIGKVARFPVPTPRQSRALAALAAQYRWREADGYLRFCYKTIKAAAPRNHREVTTLRLALQSLIRQQRASDIIMRPDAPDAPQT